MIAETDEPIKKIARDLGVASKTLHDWMQAARPEPRDPLTEDERSELERLRREVMKVRMEGDILKKAKAFSVSDPQAACARNLLVQRFTASAPNRIWTAAITALPTAEGWLYLAVILDLYSRPSLDGPHE